MRPSVVSPAAERDIASILAWTEEHFGDQARLRYESLLAQAILDVSEDPRRTGSRERTDIAPGLWTYHLWHARARGVPVRQKVKRPRHFLLFHVGRDLEVQIWRVLHDSMELDRHLPAEYRKSE